MSLGQTLQAAPTLTLFYSRELVNMSYLKIRIPEKIDSHNITFCFVYYYQLNTFNKKLKLNIVQNNVNNQITTIDESSVP